METCWVVHDLPFSLIQESKIHLEMQKTKMNQYTLRETFDDLQSPISRLFFFIKLLHLMQNWCKTLGKYMQIDQWSRMKTNPYIQGQLNYNSA